MQTFCKVLLRPEPPDNDVVHLLRFEHVAAVGLTTIACLAGVLLVRRRPGRWAIWLCGGLAILLVGTEASWWAVSAYRGRWSWAYSLPLHLCEAASFVAAAALWWRRRTLVEITYFWGLAGTLQALLTPDQVLHFPSYLYFQYYLGHAAIVFAAVFLVFGLGIAPARGAVLRVYAMTVAYTGLVAAVDFASGANYMFLRHKPAEASLLDLMGSWPWYIAGGAALALAAFLVLGLPFALARRRAPGGRLVAPGTSLR